MLGVNTTLAIDWVPSGAPRVFRSDSVAPAADRHVEGIRVFFWACLLQPGDRQRDHLLSWSTTGEAKVPRQKVSAHHRRRRAFTSLPGAPRLNTVVWARWSRSKYQEIRRGGPTQGSR